MPRVNLYVHDLDTLENLEDQQEWDTLVSRNNGDLRRDSRAGDGRGDGRGERRFGGSEALARKRADRRKNISRASRRI